MLVSLCVIARNEEIILPKLLDNIKEQVYPHEKIEVVFVDNKSADRTKNLMIEFAQNNRDFAGVYVLSGKKNTQASAWNLAIEKARGDIIIRVDAHSRIPAGFVSANVRNIKSGEYVCGGGRPNKAFNKTPWSMTMLAAEACMFGGSIAKYRREQTEKQYLNSIFHGAYRKEVFAKVGGFNEDLGRTEDNEFHYRIRQAGYKICCCPDIVSYQFIRSTFGGMIKQKFGNGYWIGLTTGVCPGCLSLFYFAPLALVLSYVICAVAACFGFLWPLILLSSIYLLFNLLVTVSAFWSRTVYAGFLLLPFIIACLHFAYGAGTLLGIIKMPFWKMRLDDSAVNRIEQIKECYKNKLQNDGEKA